MKKVNLSQLSQAHIIALTTALITQVVAYVPAWAPEKQLLISVTGIVIGAAFLIAHAISSKTTPADLAKSAETLVQAELGKVDLNALAKDALSGNAGSVVQAELRRLLGSAPVAPAPVAPAEPIQSPPSTTQA